MHFLIGQLISRLFIITIQTVVLFIIGVLILDINIALGNIYAWINIGIFSILGSILFLFIGLAISGASPNEDYAAPFANLVTFPMMFLSGVFFDNDILPGSISRFTDLLPLSPLVESLRESALYGTNTFELLPELGIILAWIIIAFVIGVKTFKWECFYFSKSSLVKYGIIKLVTFSNVSSGESDDVSTCTTGPIVLFSTKCL